MKTYGSPLLLMLSMILTNTYAGVFFTESPNHRITVSARSPEPLEIREDGGQATEVSIDSIQTVGHENLGYGSADQRPVRWYNNRYFVLLSTA